VTSFWLDVHLVTSKRRALAAKWRMPTELAVDLAALSLYDIIIYAGG